MKSMLSQFKKIQFEPLSFILEQLCISELRLLELLEIWVTQNAISEKNSVLLRLRKNRDASIKKAQQEKLEKDLLLYRELRSRKYTHFQISKETHYSYDKLNSFLRRWYSILRREGLSNKEIAAVLNATQKEMSPIIHAFEARQRERELIHRRKLALNKAYAHKHLHLIEADLHKGSEYFIFDIEAVQCPDELIEIAVIDCRGTTLYNTLIRPTHKINWRISALTGITNQMVKNKPSIQRVMRDLKALISGKTLMSWGIDYDSILLNRSSALTGIDLNCNFCCAQKIHMGLVEDTNQIALQKAAQCDTQNHRALDDCQLVLDVLRRDLRFLRYTHTEPVLPKFEENRENSPLFIQK
ncbi:MAG: 3'-5' exonuclease [Eubacterium sp.]